MDKCKNHPVRFSVARCKRCHGPICTECRIQVTEGVFCSDECIDHFRSFQSRISNLGGGAARFSFFALIKHLLIAAVLICVIWGALYIWLGTSDPAEMWRRFVAQLRLLI